LARVAALSFAISVAAAIVDPAALVAGGPVVQSSDTLGTPGRPALVSLYATELGVNETGSQPEYEMEGAIRALPCTGGGYRLVATSSFIDSSRASFYEADVRILALRLPRGVRCGSQISAYGAKVSIRRLGGTVIRTRYKGDEVAVESLTTCASLESLCPGRYLLKALVSTTRGPLELVYYFMVVVVRRSQAVATSKPSVGQPLCRRF
jgi:hypothetical protein